MARSRGGETPRRSVQSPRARRPEMRRHRGSPPGNPTPSASAGTSPTQGARNTAVRTYRAPYSTKWMPHRGATPSSNGLQ
eukprot:10331743-Alexandrium_andersonii.AAC.1